MEHILHLLSRYQYLILFPLAIVEGPIVAVIAGLLCSNQILNISLVYPIIVAGDITGDSLCYLFGRFGVPNFIKKIALKLGFKPEKIVVVRSYFDTNPIKTISLSKITLGIGVAGIYLAGNAKIPYKKFIIVCFATSALQYIFYLTIGLLFGSAYMQISRYLDVASTLIILAALAVLLWLFIKSKLKNKAATIQE
ncbi:DedA family protein [Parasediminibacterium paludis]|uniref:DedA family protein n=1 Tax=Parasediminibacterium paludis TaxID=908966 RepID=A0ABV8Q2T2_9BACT